MTIANTTTSTTVRSLRLKVNEIIGVVNLLSNTPYLPVSNSYLTSVFVTNTAFQSFVANTNAYIAATAGTGEVSNATFQSFVANTNAFIKTRASWIELATTNTALRTLISDRLQVANADNKYATKAYAASNAYVKFVLANTNAYIASVAATASPSSGSFDYGFITSAVDPDTQQDYGTL